jgi:hypothetical protein
VHIRAILPAYCFVMLLATGCGSAQDEALGGPGLPQQIRGETYPGLRQELTGAIQLATNGCVNLLTEDGPKMVIWPAGSQLGDPVRLPDGAPLADGDGIRGTGAIVQVNALAGGADGYWASVIGFCDREAREVVVFDEVRPDL